MRRDQVVEHDESEDNTDDAITDANNNNEDLLEAEHPDEHLDALTYASLEGTDYIRFI